MAYLLNLLYVALLLVGLAVAGLVAAVRKGKYRAGWGEKFLGRVPRATRRRPASGCTPSAWAKSA